MESQHTQDGIKLIKSGKFNEAFSVLQEAFFMEGDALAGCYLAMMYFDVKITPRTPDSLAKAMIIWDMTKDKVVSSRHKLGVNLYGSKIPETKKLGYKYISEAAAGNYSVAHCVLGMLFHAEGKYDKAEKELLQYDNWINDKRACIALADCLTKNDHLSGNLNSTAIKCLDAAVNKFGGTDRKLDYAKALQGGDMNVQFSKIVDIYNEEIENGYFPLLMVLSYIYATGKCAGKDIPGGPDYGKYLECMRLGADKFNDSICMYNFANGFYNAICHNQELEWDERKEMIRTCIEYAERAVDNGFEDKDCFLGDLYLTIPEIEKAYTYSRDCYFKYRTKKAYFNYESGLYWWYKRSVCAYEECFDFNHPMLKEFLDLKGQYVNNDENDGTLSDNLRDGITMFYNFYCCGQEGAMKALPYFKFHDDEPSRVCMCLGTICGYYNGVLTDSELTKYTTELADNGYPAAQYEYSFLLRQQKYYSNALEQLMNSYKNGYLPAAKAISEMYLAGQVTGRKDKRKAAEWEKKSRGV